MPCQTVEIRSNSQSVTYLDEDLDSQLLGLRDVVANLLDQIWVRHPECERTDTLEDKSEAAH